MTRRQFYKLQIGDQVRLLEDVPGRYSGYGPNPEFTAKAGDIVTIESGKLPQIWESEVREHGKYFLNASHPDWKNGLHLVASEVEKV